MDTRPVYFHGEKRSNFTLI